MPLYGRPCILSRNIPFPDVSLQTTMSRVPRNFFANMVSITIVPYVCTDAIFRPFVLYDNTTGSVLEWEKQS